MKFGGLMLHHFHNSFHIPGQGSIDSIQFEKILHYLGIERFITPENWLKKSQEKSFKGNELCITFDDNLLCQYDVALPILEKYHLKAFFFIYSSPLLGVIEKLEVYRYFRSAYFSNVEDFYTKFYETSDQSFNTQFANLDYPKNYLSDFSFYTDSDRKFRFIRDKILGPIKYNSVMDKMIEVSNLKVSELSSKLWMNKEQLMDLVNKGHSLGLHSHTHPTNLASLSYSEQKKEFEENYSLIKNIIKCPINFMAHPCNSYNEDTLNILNELKIHVGFRSNQAKKEYSSLEFPRTDHAEILKLI